MKIKVKKNPTNCIELSTLLSVPVNSWTYTKEGDMEVDVEGNLTEVQVAQVMSLLEYSKSHLITDDGKDSLSFWRKKWEQAKATQDPALKVKRMFEALGSATNLEV